MKKSFTYAALAALYIATIVSGINLLAPFVGQNETIAIPMAALSLFVLSAAIMGFLFISEPILLCFENKREEAKRFFLGTVGYFACFFVLFGIVAFSLSFV